MKILIAGGGTSGHIYPAVSIADQIINRYPNSQIEFCGTERGLESELVPAAGYKMHVIRASGFPSRPSKKAMRAMSDLIAGKKTCRSIIRDFNPDVVIGTGGYVCGPLIMAAKKERVPILLHEQNAFPGRANRMMSKWAHTVCTGFPNMNQYFNKSKKVTYTGNPVRSAFLDVTYEKARKALKINDDFFVFAMGGSLGSAQINKAVTGLTQYSALSDIHIVLSAGKQQYGVLKAYESNQNIKLEVREYVSDAHLYMAAADMIVCRAGAITCAEIACLGATAVFIPYPFAAGDHQTYNAKAFSDKGAGFMIPDAQLDSKVLLDLVSELRVDLEKCEKMALNARKLYIPDADKNVVDCISQIMMEQGKDSN